MNEKKAKFRELAEKRVSVLMGDKVEPRKEWIEENVEFSFDDNFELQKK